MEYRCFDCGKPVQEDYEIMQNKCKTCIKEAREDQEQNNGWGD